jgi:hypothetical protein
VIVTGVDVLTPLVETLNVAVVAPAETVTLAATDATPGLLLDSDTAAPVWGAPPDNMIVPCAVDPPAVLAGLTDTLCRVAGGGGGADGVTVSVPVLVAPL